MLDVPVKQKTFFEAQNETENKISELVRYIVIEAVKHGHELSAFKFCKTMNELDRIKAQKQRLITGIVDSGEPSLTHLVKEVLQADLLVDAKAKRA